MEKHLMGEIELLALAERVVKAAPIMQSALLEDAWESIAQQSADFRRFALAPAKGFDNNAAKFGMALDAGAYESAALMLVPEGWNLGQWRIIGKPDSCRIWDDVHDILASAATPALALCAAALRARASITRTTGDGDGNVI